MTLKVIGAGLGRTGTASLKVALEQIGIGRCYHMSEALAKPGDPARWVDAANGDPDWEAIFDGFSATTDFPASIYWRELMAYYPDAKIILTTRDADKWVQSTQETILGPKWWAFCKEGPYGAFMRATIDRFLEGEAHDPAHLKKIFLRHEAAVKAGVPAGRLLVFEAKDGWAPLCEFLGLPVPDFPYPYVNSSKETQELLNTILNGAMGGDGVTNVAKDAFKSDR